MDEQFTKKHQLPLLRLNKEIQVSNIDKSSNKNGPIRFHTRLPTKIDGESLEEYIKCVASLAASSIEGPGLRRTYRMRRLRVTMTESVWLIRISYFPW